VPHISARSEADLFFAQGFNAARDRLFQIDLWRRRGLGQLAEVFGPEFVPQDRAARLFLYRGDMQREWRSYSPRGTDEAQQLTQHFVAGINAYVQWLESNPARMPWEFGFYKYRPATWSAEDVVRIRSHGLTRNVQSEVARANTLCRTKDVAADQVRSGLSNDWNAQVPQGLDPCLPKDVLRVFQLATQDVAVTNPGDAAAQGSNSWVVSAAKSTTGRPIMANDPHRAYAAPSLRYIVHLTAPGLDVIGAGEPALPGISLGHNDAIAFGLTIFNIDQEDLYVYELDPADPMQYRYRNRWERFRVVRESIAVKGRAPQSVELVFSRHGPVVYADATRGRAYALRTGWLEPGMSPYFGATQSMRARSFAAFRTAHLNWGAPSLNQVYADVKGHIGWLAAGLAPRRPNWDGLLPVPGDGRYEWDGFWRGNDLPWSYDPPQGWIATANAYNIPPDYPATQRKLGLEWTNPARARRIEAVLGARLKISLDDSAQLQNDVLSIPARRLLALVAPLNSGDDKTQRALALLRGWDAQQRVDSPQAALEQVWELRHLRAGFRAAVLEPAAAAAVDTTDMNVMLDALERPELRFGRDSRAKRDLLLLATLKAAWEEMERLQGNDPAAWQWGRLQFNLVQHPFSAAVDAARRARIDVGPVAHGGSEFTPSQSATRASDFRQMSGPSVRLVVDVGNWDNSRAVNHPGQSGDPDSTHYRDLAPLWSSGEYFPLAYTRKAVEAATERVIMLVPIE
jgi:penicillin amidase